MIRTTIRPGRYLFELITGRSYHVTRNDEARPTYWMVERADQFSTERYPADTLRQAANGFAHEEANAASAAFG